MSTFDSPADAPFQIKTEGSEITLKFVRTGPDTGRVSWNIPTPAAGCSSETQVYDGIVIIIDNNAVTVAKSPINGTFYTADPTSDRDLHAGDKIDTALVIGAFYNDKTTTFFDITGLQDKIAYYVSGYAVDAQARYHTEGVHAYSLDYEGDSGTPDTSGSQTVEFGVKGTDATGLNIGELYEFTITIDGTEYPITVNGTDAQTYDNLTVAINAELSKLGNAPQSPLAPNTGAYYWNTTETKLYQWDGTEHILLDAIIEDIDPTTISLGSYWYDPTTGILQRWGTPTIGAWNSTNVIRYGTDLTALGCDDYWFNGTDAFQWDGSVWCKKIVWNQTTDPSLPVYPECGTYWYNEDDLNIYKWNDQDNTWEATSAIYWNEDPNALSVGTYWFNDTDQVLNQWNGAAWNIITSTVSETEPATPAPSMFWYDPANEELWERDLANTAWTLLPVLVWEADPTVTGTCDLWWNSTTDLLYTWDVTTSTWDSVVAFIQSVIDPAAPAVLTTDDYWFNPTNNSLSGWDGVMWNTVNYIAHPTDPTILVVDDVWYNVEANEWNRWDGAAWVSFDPIDSINDPHTLSIPAGTYWYDTTNDALAQWNGTSWVTLSFTTLPLTPATGELWYNTSSNTLMEWDGTTWVLATPFATVGLTSAGDLIFTSTTKGSTSSIYILDVSLFEALLIMGIFLDPINGTDGIDGTSMYTQIGVGTDGTPDERRELLESMRAQLGYPVIDVELTKYQFDTALTGGLEEFRKRSGAAYKRSFFFLDTQPGQQHYILADKTVGFNQIVNVTGLYRMTSAFLSSAYGSGIYGQIVLQQLYSMGTFDLLSFHLVSEYIEQMEQLFATRLTYNWNERSRTLAIFDTRVYPERILVDATIERTEQDLLTDRYTKSWIEKWALAEARLMLAEIRGKYAALPGAGGGVSLNAQDLITRADQDMQSLLDEIDNRVADTPEEFGWGTEFTIG